MMGMGRNLFGSMDSMMDVDITSDEGMNSLPRLPFRFTDQKKTMIDNP